MKKVLVGFSLLSSLIVSALLFGCSSGTSSGTSGPAQFSLGEVDGAALYNSDCSGCHGTLATSGKKGATAAMIQAAIADNKGGMGVYASLTTADIDALVKALATTTASGTTASPTASATIDGTALYNDYCSSCHGSLATSGKSGTSLGAIQTAILNNSGGMGAFANFTVEQLQAIADVLATIPPPAQSETPVPTTGSTDDGAALYASNCSGCHGELATSSKIGATDTRIQSAITNNTGGMGTCSDLTTAQIQAIATALGATSTPDPASTPEPTTSVDGSALYATYCSGCHGSLALSSKQGTSADAIQAGISGDYGGMGILASLTTEQVQAIATALVTPASTPTTPSATPASTDGAALYTAYCGSCHGALESSDKSGATVSQIQTGISSVRSMNNLSTLSTTELDAIASALGTAAVPAPTPTPAPASTDGSALYDTNCSSCHGALASSDYSGASATQIQTGISNVSSMKKLSTLTTTEIQAIADALGGTAVPTPTPAPTSTDGASLYTTNCSSCHGELASSDYSGASAAQIQTGISNVSSMKKLSTLTTTEIQAIADALGTTPTPTPTPAPAPTPTTTDGATLYVDNCSSCHGSLASSSKAGATAAQIQSAITNNSGGMGQYASLTTDQVQAIADALTSTSPTTPTDGASLYTNYCSSCHGTLASSSVKGTSSSEIQSAISHNKGGMGQLSGLTTTEIQDISSALGQQTQGSGNDEDDDDDD